MSWLTLKTFARGPVSPNSKDSKDLLFQWAPGQQSRIASGLGDLDLGFSGRQDGGFKSGFGPRGGAQ